MSKIGRVVCESLPVVASGGLRVWSGVVGDVCVRGGGTGAEGGGGRGPTSRTV